jgi:hypothetical protein
MHAIRLRIGLWLALAAAASILGLPPAEAPAEEEAGWRIVREVDGVEVARREGDRPQFRGTTVIDASLPQVLAVLRDVPRHVEWQSRCVEARVLARESDRIALLYNRMAGSWPVSDRAAVLRSETHVDGPDAVRIEVHDADSPLAPERDGAVRIQLEGRYALQALDPRRTRVEYRMRVDLGGAVPGWLAGFVAEDMPLDTLRGLRRQVAATDGAYDAFVNAWSGAVARGAIPPLR